MTFSLSLMAHKKTQNSNMRTLLQQSRHSRDQVGFYIVTSMSKGKYELHWENGYLTHILGFSNLHPGDSDSPRHT